MNPEEFLNKYPSVKRLLVFLGTSAIITLNKKFNLNLDLTDLGMLTSLAAVYLGQSAVVSKAKAAAEAAAVAAIERTPEATAASLGGKTAGQIADTQAGPKVQ